VILVPVSPHFQSHKSITMKFGVRLYTNLGHPPPRLIL